MTKTTKKSSAKRKLIPAVGMLTTSAIMLSSATYAWFTMSREVEVTGISMTATTPEDIQISLGHLTSPTGGYVDNTGTLTASSGISADDGNVKEPSTGNNETDMLDWSNKVDFGNYYLLGKIIPASSNTGASVFFTPDANGLGKTLSDGAKFYTAANGLTAKTEGATHGTSAGTGSLKTTLHAKTASDDAWTSKKDAIGWNNTQDDGYYVDIPVWIRTSSQTNQNITVDAYVVPKGANSTTAVEENKRDLYKAVRVAILDDSGNSSNLLDVKDGLNAEFKLADSPYSATDTVFTNGYYNRAAAPSSGKNAVSAVASEGTDVPTYDNAVKYDKAYKVATLTAGDGTTYGVATKLFIRVWLEGEDMDCWNANAGQDFSINLKFEKGGLDPTPGP